jgi:hypothetical protein
MKAAVMAVTAWASLMQSGDFRATYLHPSLHGNRAYCGGVYSRLDPTYLAVGPANYLRWPCGTSLTVHGPSGSIRATVQDRCPGCSGNHVDLGEAASQIVCGRPSSCRVSIVMEGGDVSTPTPTPICTQEKT